MAGLISRSTRPVLAGMAVLCTVVVPASAATQDSFHPIEKLPQAFDGAQSTLLNDGTVLITSGVSFQGDKGGVVANAALFDPKTNQFTSLSPMAGPRDDSHRAVRLQDGRVLVLGGSPDLKKHLSTAEVYDPVTRTFTLVGDMKQDRAAPTASLLPDGRVLVTGGWGSAPEAPKASAELFDPATGSFQETGRMAQARYRHAAVSLPDGRVLVLGGYRPDDQELRSVEIYDPKSGAFAPHGELAEGRGDPVALLLPDGRVLVVGGVGAGGQDGVRTSVEVYDPATARSTVIGQMADPRKLPVVALLADGRVLVAGGSSGPESLLTAEVIDFQSGTISPTAPMTTRRGWAAGARLPDGRVLVAGGFDGTNSLDTAEVFVPATRSEPAPE